MASAANQLLRHQLKRKGAAAVVSNQPNNNNTLYFFKSPTVVLPSAQLTRRILDPFYRRVYKHMIERNYTHRNFMNGAIQAAVLAAIHLRERRLDRFRVISTESLTNYMRVRLPELPQEALDEKLNFGRYQVVNGFIHASMFSLNNIAEAVLSSSIDAVIYHATCALFIDRTGKFVDALEAHEAGQEEEEGGDAWTRLFPHPKAPSISKLLDSPQDLLVCNITLSRNVGGRNPENFGRWRITDLNFFDCQFAIDKMHYY